MSEWLYEDGIGEERAMLIENGQIVEARIEPHGGIKAGLVAQVRLIKKIAGTRRGLGELANGGEVLISPLPNGITEGANLTIEVKRAAIDEKTRFKLPLAKAAPDKAPSPAPSLRERIGEATLCHAHDADRFAEYGWHDVIEEARHGQVGFAGGSLIISVTPAMTLIDVDGDLPPLALALASATAAAQAIRRLDLQGSIGIDFPGLADKADRVAVAQAFDAAMFGPFERTAVNGFGLLHMVKRRNGPSLPELLQHGRMRGHATELLRMAERERGAGALTLAAHPAIIAKLEANPEWLAMLTKRTGRAAALRADPKLAIGGYYAE
jgi:Ribonuclease E/G family